MYLKQKYFEIWVKYFNHDIASTISIILFHLSQWYTIFSLITYDSCININFRIVLTEVPSHLGSNDDCFFYYYSSCTKVSKFFFFSVLKLHTLIEIVLLYSIKILCKGLQLMFLLFENCSQESFIKKCGF